jgi:hypothetical protein
MRLNPFIKRAKRQCYYLQLNVQIRASILINHFNKERMYNSNVQQ